MSNDNKKARQQLEQQYGKGCMFKKARVAEQLEQMPQIRSYRSYLKSTRFTSKKIRELEKNITFHHLRHRSEGGKATPENGANINELAHRYIHSLPREQEEIANNMLRKFKLNGGVLTLTDKAVDLQPLEIDFSFDMESEDEYITIPVYDTTIKPEKKPRMEPFDRAKTKRQFQRQVDLALEGREDDYDDYR